MRNLEAQSIRTALQVHYPGTQDDLQDIQQYVGYYFPENALWDLVSFLPTIIILPQYILDEYIAIFVYEGMGKILGRII